MQSLPGFRDFLPKDCAARNYIFDRWREVARRYGFVEWDGPVLEPTDLYTKKSGAEIVTQLFNFTDKGEREVAMRPELTPTLARVVAAHEREFKKPLKWFSIPQCFRYEKQQRGRLREHFQFNADIIGEESREADVELVALCIDSLRVFGFDSKDFVVRISDRRSWDDFLKIQGHELNDSQMQQFLSIVDKLDRLENQVADTMLKQLGLSRQEVNLFINDPGEYFDDFRKLEQNLNLRGLRDYIRVSPGIVRGLAYYTGFVFEVFDRNHRFRAIAGGGRYDNLIHQLSDGAISLPALGFAMGDVVLGDLIAENSTAKAKMEETIAGQQNLDVYIVIAKEERRVDALKQIQALRDQNYRVDYPLTPTKVGKQFQTAEQLGARLAVLFGDEWPQVKLKNLTTGEQSLLPNEALREAILPLLAKPAA